MKQALTAGFTLIELSIVLVIIGLIVGGILTGKSLISSAQVQAQISQISKFNTAANTFRGKYGALPGDIPPPLVAQFSLTARPGTGPGAGNGDNLIQGYNNGPCDQCVTSGEEVLFWTDLSTTNLIPGNYIGTGTPAVIPAIGIPSYLPTAMLGTGNYVMVLSINWQGLSVNAGAAPDYAPYGTNYFLIQANSAAIQSNGGLNIANGTLPTGISVVRASQIDAKIDDGLPKTGNVLATGMGVQAGNLSIYLGATNACISGSSTYYLAAGDAAFCPLMFQAQF